MVKLYRKYEDREYRTEAKQVGTLYHVCTIDAFVNRIIEDNELGTKDNLHASGKYWNGLLKTYNAVSFTRDNLFVVPTSTVYKSPLLFQFTIDGNKLSEHYKITPFNGNGDNPKYREKEEVVIGPIKNFKSYIKEVKFDIKDLKELKTHKMYIKEIQKVMNYLGDIPCERRALPILNIFDGWSVDYKKSKHIYNIKTLEDLIEYIKDDTPVKVDDIDTSDLLKKFITSDSCTADLLISLYNNNPKLFTAGVLNRLVKRNFDHMDYDILSFCLSKGADINIKIDDTSLLLKALREHNLKVIKLLLENNIDTKDFFVPFEGYMNEKFEFSLDELKLLADYKVKFDIKSVAINRCIVKAIQSDDIDTLYSIMKAGYHEFINTSLRFTYGYSVKEINLLCFACYLCKKNIIDLLLSFDADVNVRDIFWNTPLMSTAIAHRDMTDKIKIIKLLLSKGATKSINTRNKEKDFPLSALCDFNDKNVVRAVKLLLDNGASPYVNMKTKDNNTPLSLACKYNNIQLVKLLLDNGAERSIDIVNKEGNTPIMIASKKAYKTLLKLLISYDADLSIVNKSGESLLLNLCENGNYDLAKILINDGADVNVQDKSGKTPLYYVCRDGNIPMAKLLITKGADVNKVPLSFYFSRDSKLHDSRIVSLLFKSGYNPNSEYAKLCLSGAVNNQRVDVVKVLLQNHVDPNITNYLGSMLSNVVGHEPNIEIATLLLEYGARIVLKVKGGYDNALQHACEFENTDIVKLLLEHGGIDYLPKNKDRLPAWATRNEKIKNLILSYYK